MSKRSLPARLAQRILSDYIASGRLRPGERLPSIRTLQKEYGGSVASIAHALGHLEAQGLLQKGPTGRSLVSDGPEARGESQTDAVGLAFWQDYTAALFTRAHEGVDRECARQGCHAVVATADCRSLTDEEDVVRRLLAAGCKAIVMLPRPRTAKELATDYLNTAFRHVPIVLIDMAYPQQKRSQVVFDNRSAGHEMTRALIARGHERIAFMTGFGGPRDLNWITNRERYLGYLSGLRMLRLPARTEDVWSLDVSGDWRGRCLDYLRAWKRSADRPTAVIAIEDAYALELVAEARELGIDTPGDLEVAGFDNTASVCPFRPSYLTTFADFAKAGEKAVQVALAELSGEQRHPATYVLPVAIVERTPHAASILSVGAAESRT